MTSNTSNTVNDQIVDSVSQLSTLMIGNSAPQSMGLLDITGAETLGMSMHNAVSTQHNSQISSSAAVTATCAKMLSSSAFIATSPKEGKATPPPPPFMPLGPDGDMSADAMLKQANALATAAISMLDSEKTDTAASHSATKEDATTLKDKLSRFLTPTPPPAPTPHSPATPAS